MKYQLMLLTSLGLSLTMLSCQRRGEDERYAGSQEHATLTDTTTPSTSITFQAGTFPPMGDRENISLTKDEVPRPCPSLELPGTDANKLDDRCGLVGVEVLNPVTTATHGTSPRAQ